MSSSAGQPVQNNLDELREVLVQIPPAPWHLQCEYAGNRETSPVAIRIEPPLESRQPQEIKDRPFLVKTIAHLIHSDGAPFTAEESQAITFLIHAPEDIRDLSAYVAWLRHATGQAPKAAPYAAPLPALEYEAIKQRAILAFPPPWAIRECTTPEKPASTSLCLYSATGHEILALQQPETIEQTPVTVQRLANFFVLARNAVPHLIEEAEYLLAQLPSRSGL